MADEHTPDLAAEHAELMEQGRVLASERDDLIAAGADPADLETPTAPTPPTAAADPLGVTCPDCQAPPTVACRTHLGTHAGRQRMADLRGLEHGHCSACGRFMVRGTVEDAPLDAWHPYPEDAASCPVLPDPTTDWNAHATALNSGLAPGHPGLDRFVP